MDRELTKSELLRWFRLNMDAGSRDGSILVAEMSHVSPRDEAFNAACFQLCCLIAALGGRDPDRARELCGRVRDVHAAVFEARNQ